MARKLARREKRARERRPREKRIFRKKVCRFCSGKIEKVDYLDYQNLRRLTTERGKILPSRITGSCAWHQRQVARAIKRARGMGLMPYVAE